MLGAAFAAALGGVAGLTTTRSDSVPPSAPPPSLHTGDGADAEADTSPGRPLRAREVRDHAATALTVLRRLFYGTAHASASTVRSGEFNLARLSSTGRHVPCCVLYNASGGVGVQDDAPYELRLTLPRFTGEMDASGVAPVPVPVPSDAGPTPGVMGVLEASIAAAEGFITRLGQGDDHALRGVDMFHVLSVLQEAYPVEVQAACEARGVRVLEPKEEDSVAGMLNIPAWLLQVPVPASDADVLTLHTPNARVTVAVNAAVGAVNVAWHVPRGGQGLTHKDLDVILRLYADSAVSHEIIHELNLRLVRTREGTWRYSYGAAARDDSLVHLVQITHMLLGDMAVARRAGDDNTPGWPEEMQAVLSDAFKARLKWPSLNAMRAEAAARSFGVSLALAAGVDVGRMQAAAMGATVPAAAAAATAEGVTSSAGSSSQSSEGGKSSSSAAAAGASSTTPKDPLKTLQSLGVRVYTRESHTAEHIDWDTLAGYDEVRKDVEDHVLYPLRHPELYERINALTRVTPEPNQFGTFLFSGPPGTGKTLTARIVAASADRPLVCLNFESVGSQFFSKSEANLKEVLDAVTAIDGAILFIDEAESFFPSRFTRDAHGSSTSSIHNKLLSLMLKFLEGMQGGSRNTVIFASNRAGELDPALISRCAGSVTFELPTASQRNAIWRRYAKHLGDGDLRTVVDASDGMSGRDIKRCAEVAERRHAAALQRGSNAENAAAATTVDAITPPPVDVYMHVVEDRLDGVLSLSPSDDIAAARRGRSGGSARTKGSIEQWRARRQREEEKPPQERVPSSAAGGGSNAGVARHADV